MLPGTSAGKLLLKDNISQSNVDRLNIFSKDTFETFNLKYFKWMLGLHNHSSNIAIYGDTGRLPIAINIIPQCVKYFRRAEQKSMNEAPSQVI